MYFHTAILQLILIQKLNKYKIFILIILLKTIFSINNLYLINIIYYICCNHNEKLLLWHLVSTKKWNQH